MLEKILMPSPAGATADLTLGDGSRVAVMGGGPAGSFFSFFLLEEAQRVGLDLQVDIYEPRDFARPAPYGCNMCGGIVSESLVQLLATEGINLPTSVVQRGIDSYVMHTDLGSTFIKTPLHEKRIGAIHRGAGPRNMKDSKWHSFDGHLLSLATDKGARMVSGKVDQITWTDGHPQIKAQDGSPQTYDLLVVTTGVNTNALGLFDGSVSGYRPPGTTKTSIREYYLGQETIQKYLGNSMHVFLLDIPRLVFAAIIPKGDYVTVCLLGDDIDAALIKSFLDAPEVTGCMPPDWQWDKPDCQCAPRIIVAGAAHPYGDRLVFIGDCATTRLYKDGIGAAYRAAKIAATTAVFEGVSAQAFEKRYWPACQSMDRDNSIGKFMFTVTRQIQKRRFARKAVVRMTEREQAKEGRQLRMSTVLWDMFTGSQHYGDVFRRTLHPAFIARLTYELATSILPLGNSKK
ncbi:MAG: hypothetical protein Q7O66_11660 [Dehalococcoidia bacterium]|nr:hypothetical protein [Dehalococcoidia bacterium]